jgi:hypothetical protein
VKVERYFGFDSFFPNANKSMIFWTLSVSKLFLGTRLLGGKERKTDGGSSVPWYERTLEESIERDRKRKS